MSAFWHTLLQLGTVALPVLAGWLLGRYTQRRHLDQIAAAARVAGAQAAMAAFMEEFPDRFADAFTDRLDEVADQLQRPAPGYDPTQN